MSTVSNSRNYYSHTYNHSSRNTHSPAPSYDSSRLRSESRNHSRLAGIDSSSLLASQQPHDYRRDDYRSDDPYAPRRPDEWHDPQDSSGPLLPQQDDTVMDMHDFNSPLNKEASPLNKSSSNNKDSGMSEKRRRLCCGLGRKNLVAIGFVFLALVVLVWYFTWPRAFEIDLVETQLYGNSTYQWQTNSNGVTTGLQVTWNITMEADNKANWVPTQVSRLDLNIYDHNTGAKFANASTGSFVLGSKERKHVYFISTIDLQERPTSDQTLQDLTSACYTSPSPGTGPQYSLNLIYEVTYHISGFIWTYQTQQTDPSFHCPS